MADNIGGFFFSLKNLTIYIWDHFLNLKKKYCPNKLEQFSFKYLEITSNLYM